MHTPENLESVESTEPVESEPTAVEQSPLAEPTATTEGDPADQEVVAPEPDADSPIVEALSRIEARLEESQRLLDRQSEIAAKLHAENQLLRAGELRKAQTGVVLSVLRVFDDVNQMAATAKTDAAREDLSLVADSLRDALARNGIDPVLVEEGMSFDGRRHKIVTIEQSPDPDADRTVARVLRPGFAWSDGDLVRVSDVAVYKYTAPAEPPAAADAAEPQSAASNDR
jgi:molecular chaperone GrpE (heat shock protein)